MEQAYEEKIKQYSQEELGEILNSVDKEKYPERYSLVKERYMKLTGNEIIAGAPASSKVEFQKENVSLYNERHIGQFQYNGWIGILFGVSLLICEAVDGLAPRLGVNRKNILTIELILFGFGYIYYLYSVFRLHAYLRDISDGKYPLSPRKAALFHLIPIYGIFWPHNWTRKLFLSLNKGGEKMSKISKYGIAICVGIGMAKFDLGFSQVIIFIAFNLLIKRVISEFESQKLGLFIHKKMLLS